MSRPPKPSGSVSGSGLTHSAVVSPEPRVSLLVGEVGAERDLQRVSGRLDDPLIRNRLRVRVLLTTEQGQNLVLLCLHLDQQKHEHRFIVYRCEQIN